MDSVKQERGGHKKVDSSRPTRPSQQHTATPGTSASHVGRSSHSQQAGIIEVPSAADGPPPAPPEPVSTITASALASVKIGMPRQDLLRSLGKPTSSFSVAGSDGVNEYLSYQVEDGRKVTIRVLSGKVVELP